MTVLLASIDTDGNGTIEFEEFRELIEGRLWSRRNLNKAKSKGSLSECQVRQTSIAGLMVRDVADPVLTPPVVFNKSQAMGEQPHLSTMSRRDLKPSPHIPPLQTKISINQYNEEPTPTDHDQLHVNENVRSYPKGIPVPCHLPSLQRKQSRRVHDAWPELDMKKPTGKMSVNEKYNQIAPKIQLSDGSPGDDQSTEPIAMPIVTVEDEGARQAHERISAQDIGARHSNHESHSGNSPRASTRELAERRIIHRVITASRQGVRQMQQHVNRFIEHRWFLRTVFILIGLNTIFLALEHHNQPQELENVLRMANLVFTILFSIEMVCCPVSRHVK